jgi:hypothetical protein
VITCLTAWLLLLLQISGMFETSQKFFYELLELDAQRYLFYEDPIYHDFISKRYLIGTKVNFN